MTSSTTEHDRIRAPSSNASGDTASLALEAARPPARSTTGGDHLDRVGIAWSLLCALHCAAPLVVMAAAVASGAHAHAHAHEHEHRANADVQLSSAVVSVALAGLVLGRSFLAQHRDRRPIVVLAVGTAALAFGHFLPWSPEPTSLAVTTAGFLAVAAAQVMNVLLLRRRNEGCCGQRLDRRASVDPSDARPGDAELAPRNRATEVRDMLQAKTCNSKADLAPRVLEPLASRYPELLRFVERRVGRRDVAEDIVQETFAQSIEKLATLRDPNAMLGWFYRALRNSTVDHQRRARMIERSLSRFAHEIDTVEEPPDAVLAKTCQCAQRAAGRLKPEYADALQSMEIEGASLKRFGEERGISAGNAAVRLFRAREALRRALEASCGRAAAHGCSACACEDVDGSPCEQQHVISRSG